MSIIVDLMVFYDVMKHVAQELSKKGRLILTGVVLCGFAGVLFQLSEDRWQV